MKLTKFQLNKSREQHLDAVTETLSEPQYIERHCPRCFRYTKHRRYVHGAMEELVCQNPHCGNVQTYLIR